MISANEKRFFFQSLCQDLIRAYIRMTECDGQSSDYDDPRKVAYERASFKLLGMCIPYEYTYFFDFKKKVITIYTNDAERVYMTFNKDDVVEDL